MNVVVDANIIIAALMGSRSTIAILSSQNYSFYSPKYIIEEIKGKKEFICERIGITSREFDLYLKSILVLVKVVDSIEYEKFIPKAEKEIGKRDIDDLDYLACALYLKANFIWTNDKDFEEQKLMPFKTTEEIVDER